MASTDHANSALQDAQTHAGKFLTFFLGSEEYGLEILAVHEIIGMMKVTAVPRMPPFIRGVLNLRGKVIPVIDLRVRFSLDVTDTNDTCIIVVQVRGIQMGIVVDRVSEVVNIAADAIEPPPSFGFDVPTDFLLGLGKSQGRVKLLLNIDRVLSDGELQQTAAAAHVGTEDGVST